MFSPLILQPVISFSLTSCSLTAFTAVGLSGYFHNMTGHKTRSILELKSPPSDLELLLSEVTTPHGMGGDSVKIQISSITNGKTRFIDRYYFKVGCQDFRRILSRTDITFTPYDLQARVTGEIGCWMIEVPEEHFSVSDYSHILAMEKAGQGNFD